MVNKSSDKSKKNQSNGHVRHPYEGYPASFCQPVREEKPIEADRGEADMLAVLRRLRNELRGTEYCIECELGEYVLLDGNTDIVYRGTPSALARFCLVAEIVEPETYRYIAFNE